MQDFSELTIEQLEQNVCQRVKALYQTHLGHQIHQVSCKLIAHTLTIVVEDSITHLENFLAKNNQYDLAKQVRLNLLKGLEPHLKILIEAAANVPVVDVLCDSVLDTGRTSIVAVLGAMPELS